MEFCVACALSWWFFDFVVLCCDLLLWVFDCVVFGGFGFCGFVFVLLGFSCCLI